MNQHHPIDDLFNRKLGDYVSETPMHLWEKVDQKRHWRHKVFNQLRLYKQHFLVTFSLILVLSVWQFTRPQAPQLGHFPVPELPGETAKDNPVHARLTENASGNAASLPSDDFRSATTTSLNVKEEHEVDSPEHTVARTMMSREQDTEAVNSVLEQLPIKGEEQAGQQKTEASKPQASNRLDLQTQTLAPLATLEPSLEETDLWNIFHPEPKCAKFKHGQWLLYLDMMASPDFPIRSLKAKNSAFYNYVENRKQTESVEFSYSMGFRLSAVSSLGLAIRTGLNYTQINEQFNYYNQNEERIIIDNVYGPNGEIVGTDTTVVTGVRHKVSHNKFQIVDLPIILGYEKEYKKFVFTANAGAHINLFFDSEGDFLSPELEPVSFSSDDPDGLRAFRNHLGIGWYGSLGVQYRLSPRFNVMIEPYFKMYPKGFSRSQYMVDQQYLSTGLSIGIRQQI